MLVPPIGPDVRAGELDEADATFDETTGEQALPSVDPGRVVPGVHAVELLEVLRLGTDVHEFGHGPLHPEGEFLVSNRGVDGVMTT